MQTLIHPRPAAADRHYAAVLLTLKVRTTRLLPRFVAGIKPILDQVATTDGIVCYGFDVDWQRLTFTTFAAADAPEVLTRFARSGEHGRLAGALAGRLGPVNVVELTVPGAGMPRTWADVETLTALASPAGAR